MVLKHGYIRTGPETEFNTLGGEEMRKYTNQLIGLNFLPCDTIRPIQFSTKPTLALKVSVYFETFEVGM